MSFTLLDAIVEERIQAAVRRGEFDDLPGAGRPLEIDGDLLVPEERRVAYRILKNAGFVPPEVEWRREIHSIAELVRTLDDGPDHKRAIARMNYLSAMTSIRGGRAVRIEEQYCDKVVERLGNG